MGFRPGPAARPLGLASRRSLATERTLRRRLGDESNRGRRGPVTRKPRSSRLRLGARDAVPAPGGTTRVRGRSARRMAADSPPAAGPRRARRAARASSRRTPACPSAASAKSGGRPRKTASGAECGGRQDVRPAADSPVDVHLGRAAHARPRRRRARRRSATARSSWRPPWLETQTAAAPGVDAAPGVVRVQHALDHDRAGRWRSASQAMSCGPRSVAFSAPRWSSCRVREVHPQPAGLDDVPDRRAGSSYFVPTTGVSAVSTIARAPASTARSTHRAASPSRSAVTYICSHQRTPVAAISANGVPALLETTSSEPASRRGPGHRDLAVGVGGPLQRGRRDGERRGERRAQQRRGRGRRR